MLSIRAFLAAEFIILLLGWSLHVHGQGIELRAVRGASGNLVVVQCISVIPGVMLSDVTMSITGPGGSIQPIVIDDGNFSFRYQILFLQSMPSDSGMYTCTVSVRNAELNSKSFGVDFTLNVTGVLFSIISQPPGPATVGVNFTLTCSVQIDGTDNQPEFSWFGPAVSDPGTMIVGFDNSSQLQFLPSQDSFVGTYICQVSLNNITINENIEVVPTVNVSIMSIGGVPMVGRSYEFTCDVIVETDFGQRILYSFLQNNEIITNQSSEASLEFTRLSLADAGIYECSVEISSDLLINNIMRTTMQGNQIVNLIIPTPSVSVEVSNQAMNNLSNLTCVINFDKEIVNIELMLTVEWTGPEASQLNITTMVNITPTELPYEDTIQLSEVINGDYTCRVRAMSNVLQEFITDSEIGSNTISIGLNTITIGLEEDDDTNIAAIVGGIVGGFILFVILLVIVVLGCCCCFYVYKRKTKKDLDTYFHNNNTA